MGSTPAHRWGVLACPCCGVTCVVRFAIFFATITGTLATATPETIDLRQRLKHPLTATWHGQQLHNAIGRLAELERISIWLDRRMDPNQTIRLSVQDLPLGETLTKLARASGGEVAFVGGLVYVGPKGAALEIAAIREELRASLANASLAMSSRWLKSSTWSWPRLSEPRKILKDLFSNTKIEIRGFTHVSHDLWPAQQLPPLALIDRAILALYGFDLTLQIAADGKSCRIVPIKRPWDITRQYPIPSKRWPAVPQPHKKNGAVPRLDQKVYSLRIREKSVGDVLQQLAKQLHLDLQWDEKQLAAEDRTFDTRISCEVESVDLDQLLDSVLAPAGLQFERKGTVVRIKAAIE